MTLPEFIRCPYRYLSALIQCNSVTLDQISPYPYQIHQQNLFLIILPCGIFVTILLLILKDNYNIN